MEKIKENSLHHYMAIELNIQTWNLLQKMDRNKNDDKRMLFFAKTSLYHWQKSPHYKLINKQRGEWLISHVYAVLNQGEESLAHANSCMDITMKESIKDFDLAYAYECKARAYAALGDSDKMNKCFLNAKIFGEKIELEKDRKIFFNDLYKEPWYECNQ
tara:strand:+ start:139 stop:615 length:477 start_codon:yes stop_codon:yes gene_type:complete